jgi:hypothetical protein
MKESYKLDYYPQHRSIFIWNASMLGKDEQIPITIILFFSTNK